jgi:cation diffusion facilitator CzcD-associated flavoprotein CzcO
LIGSFLHILEVTMDEKAASDKRLEQVVIVGAGFGGLAMACELKRKLNFHDFVIYERDGGLGGTWYHNDCMSQQPCLEGMY